jgi:hypothetical protein
LAGWGVAVLLVREGLVHHAPLAFAAAALAAIAAAIASWPYRPAPNAAPAGRLRLVSCLVAGCGLLTAIQIGGL